MKSQGQPTWVGELPISSLERSLGAGVDKHPPLRDEKRERGSHHKTPEGAIQNGREKTLNQIETSRDEQEDQELPTTNERDKS